MLYSINDLAGYEIDATDGSLGHIRGFFFDPQSWIIHYLIVDTHEWLRGRKVLISLAALGQLNARMKSVPVSLSKVQIRDSPTIEKDAPTISLHELDACCRWQFTTGDMPKKGVELAEAAHAATGDVQLRSTHEAIGFHVEARDGYIGHVEDFVIDDEKWTVDYIVIDTQRWGSGKKVLVLPNWTEEVDWRNKKIYLAATQDQINSAPEYDPSSLQEKEYEERLREFHSRPFYWEFRRVVRDSMAEHGRSVAG